MGAIMAWQMCNLLVVSAWQLQPSVVGLDGLLMSDVEEW